MNDPVNLIDPMGTDWVDRASNFIAGFGDGASLGLSKIARDAISDYYFGTSSGVDECSGAYTWGGRTELLLELGLTGASAALRTSAARISQQAARSGMRGVARGVKGVSELHHINPLKTGLFPTASLPASIRHNRLNLKLLTLAGHKAAHAALSRSELYLVSAFNPLTTSGRIAQVAGAEQSCGCQ
jgi:hypothetical protein